MDYKILIIEDEKEIRNIVEKYLQKEGYIVKAEKDGFEGLSTFAVFKPHLVILDIMMPGISGFNVLKEIRLLGDIPVIMLTAKHMEMDRINGFDLGADDYVVKPFSPKELVRRVNAVIKRTYSHFFQHEKLFYGPFKLDISNQILYKDDVVISLTAKEFMIIKTFFENIGILLSRNQLIEKAFGELYEGYDRAIDNQVKKIRQKIEIDTKNPKYLKTKYGAGYIFGGDKYDL